MRIQEGTDIKECQRPYGVAGSPVGTGVSLPHCQAFEGMFETRRRTTGWDNDYNGYEDDYEDSDDDDDYDYFDEFAFMRHRHSCDVECVMS
ncbi:hypothetical protein ACN47E_007466 [Coniothyrium glycines]